MFVSDPAILHADLDSFYASVEQRDDARLRGRPVIVGGGVVLAASYEAKAYGVRTAMGGGLARRLCPRAVVVPPRFAAYTAASRAVFEVFRDTSPLVEGDTVIGVLAAYGPSSSALLVRAVDEVARWVSTQLELAAAGRQQARAHQRHQREPSPHDAIPR